MFTNGCLETQFDLKGKVAPNFPNYPMVNHHKNPKWWVPKGEGRRGGGEGGGQEGGGSIIHGPQSNSSL
jgi:hypothetical protein